MNKVYKVKHALLTTITTNNKEILVQHQQNVCMFTTSEVHAWNWHTVYCIM